MLYVGLAGKGYVTKHNKDQALPSFGTFVNNSADQKCWRYVWHIRGIPTCGCCFEPFRSMITCRGTSQPFRNFRTAWITCRSSRPSLQRRWTVTKGTKQEVPRSRRRELWPVVSSSCQKMQMLLQKIVAIHQLYRKDRLSGSMCASRNFNIPDCFALPNFFFFFSPQSCYIMTNKSTSLKSMCHA